MDIHPMINEPSFENTKIDDPRAIEYNEYIRFHTHEFAMYEMLTNKDHFPYFQEVIEKYFVDNYERISKKLTELSKWDGKIMKTFIWGHSVKVNYSELLTKFQNLYEKLKDKKFSDEKTSVHVSDNKKKLDQDI
jgi:hypothetical protein